jgi:hypothetical protein
MQVFAPETLWVFILLRFKLRFKVEAGIFLCLTFRVFSSSISYSCAIAYFKNQVQN